MVECTRTANEWIDRILIHVHICGGMVEESRTFATPGPSAATYTFKLVI